MPSYRIGFGSDFTLLNQLVGVGTTAARRKLQVAGTLKGDFNITGVSTLTVYGGFVSQKQNVSLASTIGFSTTGIGTFTQPNERETGYLSLVGEYNTVSEDLIVDEGKIFEVSTTNITGITTLGTQEVYAPDDSVVSVGTLESVSIQSHFSVPDGGSNDRPDQPTEGMVRFNDDLNTLEFYNGIEWRQFTVSGASGRGLFNLADTAQIDFINISSQGNSLDFGNVSLARHNTASFASEIRGLWAGGLVPAGPEDRIDYVTIASEGNAIDFGNLAPARYGAAGCSSSTRGIVAGGNVGSPYAARNEIDYVEIATLGDAVDFGTLSVITDRMGGCSSPTRGIFAGGGSQPVSSYVSKIEYVIIASKGNSVDTGYDLTERRQALSGASNSVRGIFRAGQVETAPNNSNTIDYITLASLGNAIDFGDATIAVDGGKGVANSTRVVFAGGETNPAGPAQNIIEFVTIASTGNAQDFGDLTKISRFPNACSDSHGGLGGF
jgi:hypothetical protein